MASKVWETMNDLEMTTTKIVSAREIIDAAIDRLQEHQYDKAETMIVAAYEFLEYYLNEFDTKFKLAWQETVVKQKKEEDDAWDAVNKEKEYYEPSMPPWCHSDLEYALHYKDPITGHNYQGSTVSSVKYTDEELDAMCDKAASDQLPPQQEYLGWKNVSNQEFDKMFPKKDKITKWVLPVEEAKDADTDETEYFIQFPDDLLEAADLKEGDQIEWIDQGDGSYLLKRKNA